MNDTPKIILANDNKHKYVAIFKNPIQKIPFGSINYEHFRDSTPLRAFSHLDHNDITRKNNYIAGHTAIRRKDGGLAFKNKRSAAYLSIHYLWT